MRKAQVNHIDYYVKSPVFRETEGNNHVMFGIISQIERTEDDRSLFQKLVETFSKGFPFQLNKRAIISNITLQEYSNSRIPLGPQEVLYIGDLKGFCFPGDEVTILAQYYMDNYYARKITINNGTLFARPKFHISSKAFKISLLLLLLLLAGLLFVIKTSYFI